MDAFAGLHIALGLAALILVLLLITFVVKLILRKKDKTD